MLGTSQTLNKGRYQVINSFSNDSSGAMYEAVDTVNRLVDVESGELEIGPDEEANRGGVVDDKHSGHGNHGSPRAIGSHGSWPHRRQSGSSIV